MRERLTARVLLFDPDHRLLMMKGRLSPHSDRPGEWFTIGGGVEQGESLAEAAAREIVEESGIADFVLGPVVWRRDVVLRRGAEPPVKFREHYFVANCAGGEPSRAGWNAVEQALIDDMRWLSVTDLQASPEPVHPKGIADRLGELIAGRYPTFPLVLDDG